MKLLEQGNLILAQDPLPDDALEQFDALIAQARGQERQFLRMSVEALYAAATPEQLAKWNAEPSPEDD